MLRKRFRYLVLVIFIASIILIVFLQYNSGKSIENLIGDNKSLLSELQIKTKLQKLQTDVIFSESALRDLITNDDEQHVLDLKKSYVAMQGELMEIDGIIRSNSDGKLTDQLRFLMDEKIENSYKVISELNTDGKDSALAFIRTLRGRIIRDSLIQTISLIDQNRQTSLSNISASVSMNSVKAKSWGIILAIVACLASIIAFWYLVDQSLRQQKLIKTLDTSEKKLKEASKIREQFVANISHEIRTPMNAILGFTGLLQKTDLTKNQQDYIRSIRSSAENLLTIINDILDLSRIESGMMHIERLPFNLRELMDSLITMMSVKAKDLNLYLHTEIDNSIPFMLNGDAIRLTQILINLISNALKFTHEGGVTVKAELIDKKDEIARIRFSITDTGIGIEREKLRTVFERFHQAQPETTRRYGGTGLGLSIVKQLVEIQKGTLGVRSEPGKGSEFVVELSYQIVSGAKAASSFSTDELVIKPFFEKIKILVAEDNLMNQKLVKYLLEQWQIDFDIRSNGTEAIEALQKYPDEYNLILMDIQMPEMDGYTATEKIRNELNSAIPIIAMTAHALAGEKEKCLAAGMDDYISKPLHEEQLYRLINKYASKKNIHRTSVIDLEYLQTISKGDKVFEKNMIRSFSMQIPEELSKLKTAIEHEDYGKIYSVTHTMKSTVLYMGLQELAGLLEEIESESENKTGLANISNNFALIDSTCQLALKEAEELIF